MSLHYPLGYVGYETDFLKVFIDLLDTFCNGCHTNDDVDENCDLCPMGHLILTAKNYLLDSYGESDTMLQIKKEIVSISPYPCFNSNWIFQNKRSPDILQKLRELLKDMEFNRNYNIHYFLTENKILDRLYQRVKNELQKGG